MNKTLYFIIGVTLYFCLNLIIGFFGFRKMSDEQVTTAKNQTGFINLTITLISTIVGGGMFLGVAEMGYNGGLIFLGVGFVYLFGSILLGLYAPYIRKFLNNIQANNLFELLEKCYPERAGIISIKNCFAIASFIVFFLMLAVQFVGIAIFYSYFTKTTANLDTNAILVASGIGIITTIVYSAFGGFKKDILTDVVQFIFIIIGIITLYLFSNFHHNIISTLQNLPASDYSLKGKYNFIYLLGILLFVAPSFFTRYDIWQRIITAKTDKVATSAFITSGILALIFFCLFGFIGLYAKGLGISNGTFSALEVINNELGPIPFTISILAFFAAVMSSADTFLGVASLSLSNLIHKDFNGKTNSRKTYRAYAILIGVISSILALFSRNIVDLFSISFGILMVFIPTIYAAMFVKHPSLRKAKWSIIIGLILFVIAAIFRPTESFIVAMVSSVITYFLTPKAES